MVLIALMHGGGHDMGQRGDGALLAVAHSHNDFEQRSPLFEAVRSGFPSVEADVSSGRAWRGPPARSAPHRAAALPGAAIQEVDDGTGFAALKQPKGGPFLVQSIFTDFKRHDLGPDLHERNWDGTLQTQSPDDTASNLDPGNRSAPGFPQFGHGSIRLSVLFNDPADLE